MLGKVHYEYFLLWLEEQKSHMLNSNSGHGLFTGQQTNGESLGGQRGHGMQRLENKRNRFSKFITASVYLAALFFC